MLSEGFVAYLLTQGAVTALLGTTTSRGDKTNGIFPMIAPTGTTMPYVSYQQISGEPLQESMAGTGRLQSARYRFSCYGTTHKNAKTLAREVKNAFNSCFGAMPAGNVEMHGSWLKLEADDAEPIPHGTIYSTHIDYEFNWLDYDD